MHKESTDRSAAKFDRARLFILSLAASAACLPFLFPFDYLMGLGRYWENPASEINVALAGLRYYVSENQWFPLGHIRSINTPEGINVLYEGAVPLVAFLAKIMNQIFGVKINSIYVWSLASTILQGVSFAYLITALNIRRGTIVVMVSVIGMLMPAYIWRLEHAVALPHFLISFGLAYYFIISGKDNSPTVIRRAIILSAVMLVISYLLNPYITAMIIPIYVASLMHAIFARKISPFYGVGAVLFVVLGMAVTAYVFGYFYGDKLARAAGGFNFFSMNLVGPFDVGYSSLFKIFVPGLLPANATGGQQEGMQYLGVGWLFLIIFAALLNGRSTIKSIRYHYLLTITLLGMALFSLSNKIYFGNTLLFEFSVPKLLVGITETFRGSGRFFWPMGYLLVAVAIVAIVRKMQKSSPLVLCVAIALQVGDTHELRQSLWNILSGVNAEGKPAGKYESVYGIGGVPSPVMNNLLKNHQAIRQYPSWWCGGVGNQIFEMEINYVASKYLVSQNSFYTGRANKDCYAEDLEARNVSALAPETLYIFAQRYGDLVRLHSQGVDLRACRILGSFGAQPPSLWYSKKPPIICSEKIKSQQIDITSGIPQGWGGAHGGLFPIDPESFSDMPVIRQVSASGSFIEELYRPENVIDNRTGEDDGRFPEYWISPNWADGWIRLDLDGSYVLSEVRILNTNNGGAGDRAAGTAKLELFGKDGAISYKDEVKVAEYPQWTSIKINPPTSVHAVKIFISKGKVNGTGLNEIRLIGAKGMD